MKEYFFMDIIPFFQEVLIVVAIIFAVVLAVSYIYTKFIKSDKEETSVVKVSPDNQSAQSKSNGNKRTINYTASVDAQKLYVNTEEHRKHVVTNKAVSKPKRFQIINKTGSDE